MEMIQFQDKKWIIKMKCKDDEESSELLDWFKFYHRADMILKKDNMLFFVEEIPEIKFEEI